jgi:CheY-like chemotaxis protein
MSGKTILWVEDDADLVAGLRGVMEREGWTVEVAGSAEEAKAKVDQVRPDLIVMDIIMGGEHGFAAIEDLRMRPELEKVPIVIFSSVSHRWVETTATRRDGLVSEANEFVDKTRGPGVLMRVLRKYLSGA